MIDVFDGEKVIHEMLAKAEVVVHAVFAEFSISHVVAGFSGGDDSIVSTHWAHTYFGDALTMIGDTRVGLQATRDHQDAVVSAQKWDACRVSPSPEGPPKGWDKDWVDGETSYEEFVLNHGFPGNGQHHRMYQRLKQRAFRKIKKQLGKRTRGSRILVVSGIRKDESSIRAGYKRAFAEEKSECMVWMNPFYHCTAADFAYYREEFGLPKNPVKAIVGISGECECGAHATDGEREAIWKAEPAFGEYLFGNLERRVMERFPWRWDEKPPQWFVDAKRGQGFLFDPCEPQFMPACVGCNRRNRN